MDTSVRLQSTVAAPLRSQTTWGLLGIPLYVYATVFSLLCIIVGLIWAIYWHTSIGRDGLLSPHLVIYLGAPNTRVPWYPFPTLSPRLVITGSGYR